MNEPTEFSWWREAGAVLAWGLVPAALVVREAVGVALLLKFLLLAQEDLEHYMLLPVEVAAGLTAAGLVFVSVALIRWRWRRREPA